MDRREFIRAATVMAAGAPSVLERLTSIYDLEYAWSRDRQEILELRQLLGDTPVEIVTRKLSDGTQYGLVEDANLTRSEAQQMMEIRRGLPLKPRIIPDGDYERTWNISYEKGPFMEGIQRTAARVVERLKDDLGKDISKQLVVEHAEDGEFVLVYRRYGDRSSSTEEMREHRDSLEAIGESAALTPARTGPYTHFRLGELPRAPTRTPDPAAPATHERPVVVARDDIDSPFEERADTYWKGRKDGSVIPYDTRVGAVLYDLTNEQKLLSIHEDVPMLMASMAKIALGLGILHKDHLGELDYDERTKKSLEHLIAENEIGAHWMELSAKVGGPEGLNRILNQSYGGIFRNTQVVRDIPASGQEYDNRASPHDWSRFLHAVYNDNLPMSAELKRLLRLQEFNRIFSPIPNIPGGTPFLHKTGSTGRVIGDMGIIEAIGTDDQTYPYIIVGILERTQKIPEDDYYKWFQQAGNAIRGFSGRAYDYMKTIHPLQ